MYPSSLLPYRGLLLHAIHEFPHGLGTRNGFRGLPEFENVADFCRLAVVSSYAEGKRTVEH